MTEKNQLYKKKIIKHLYFSSPLSCADLSDKINKSLPVTTKMLGRLIEEGWVTETGFAASTGGRRAVMYSLKPDVLYVVSVAMDQLITRIAILNMQNNQAAATEIFELPLPKNARALALLTEKIDDVINRSGISKNNIAGVGIGMPGFVDAIKGQNYSFLEPEQGTLTQYISATIKLP